jgi:phosphoribosylformylglycinamidine synthase
VKIKDLLINKVESQEKDLSILDIPAEETPSKVLFHENFINFNDAELENL